MDYRAYLMLDGGDEDINDRILKYYSALRSLNENIIKETKLQLYDIELLIQKSVEDLPARSCDLQGRQSLALELEGNYLAAVENIMGLYFSIFERSINENINIFEDENEEEEEE